MIWILIVEDVKEMWFWLCVMVESVFQVLDIYEVVFMCVGLVVVNFVDFDFVLIDFGLLDGLGLEVLCNFKLVCFEVICIVIMVMGDDVYIVVVLFVGVDGYLFKDILFDLFECQFK